MRKKRGLLASADHVTLLSELLREDIVFIPLPQPVEGLAWVLRMWANVAKVMECKLIIDSATPHPVWPAGEWLCVRLKR